MLRNKRSLAARQREMRKRQPPQPGRGRPKLNIDPENVRLLARYGFCVEETACLLRCSPSSIRGRFRADYQQGSAELDCLLLTTAFRLAQEGNFPALHWQMWYRDLYPGAPRPRGPRLSREAAIACGAFKKRRAGSRENRGVPPRKARLRTNIPSQVPAPEAVKPVIALPAPAPKWGPWRNIEFAI